MIGLRKATTLFLFSWLRVGKTTTAFTICRPFVRLGRSFGGTALTAKPKRGSIVDTYQTVSVNCAKCGTRLFRYKKKNGTKSNLIKCYVERIAEDCCHILPPEGESIGHAADTVYACPSCDTAFARPAVIKGLPALKLVGGKTRMTKK